MDKLKELQRLHKETEVNFKIATLWDGPHTFYFNSYYKEPWDYKNNINPLLWLKQESFETLEEGIDFLIKCYEKLSS